jgi:hypothetical protein
LEAVEAVGVEVEFGAVVGLGELGFLAEGIGGAGVGGAGAEDYGEGGAGGELGAVPGEGGACVGGFGEVEGFFQVDAGLGEDAGVEG